MSQVILIKYNTFDFMDQLLEQIRACDVCQNFLPFPPRPIIQASVNSRVVIIGQAPGQKVNQCGIHWDDLSGNELRRWLGVEKEQFYNKELFALIPMGFCYPGKSKSGDLPPRAESVSYTHLTLPTKRIV